MTKTRDVQKILHRYARHVGSPRFSMEPFLEYVSRFVRRYEDEHPELSLLAGDQGPEILNTTLEELEQSQVVRLTRDGGTGPITHVYYAAYFSVEVQRWYSRMAEDRSLPFPGEKSLELAVPSDLLQTVDVANNLMHWIESAEEDPSQVLLLRFPEGIESILSTVRVLREFSLTLVLAKVREYLRTDRNASFMETKLRSVFPTREVLLHEEIETAQTRPDDMLQSIVSPNDFQFHFWTQLSSMIIKEYAKKHEKLDMEHSFCQAAYLLGYYAVFHKGRARKDQERAEARKILRSGVQKPPYVFGFQDLYKLADEKGVPLEKKVESDELNDWIREMLERPSDREVSELVLFDTPDNKGLIVHSAQYIPLLRRQIKAAGSVLTRELTNRMVQELSEYQRGPWIDDDTAFESVLDERVKADYPLLFGLAAFNTLFLVIDGQELTLEQREAALAMIDKPKKAMRSWSEILQVDRREIYRDARLQLPIWMLIPVVRGIVRLLKRMYSVDGGRRRSTAPEQSARAEESSNGNDREARRQAFREAVIAMQKQYLTPDQTAEQRLRQLRSSWNPLIDPVASENLVEDVNALCRDSLRRMRSIKALKAPDHGRIREQAKRIAANKAFDRIKRRKEFETYLELYMITVLQKS